MDLTGVETVLCPRARAEVPAWQAGDAVLAGGTWLFSEPQPGVRRLIDLHSLGWAALRIGDGLTIAATCTIAELAAASLPADWAARSLVRPCCEALLGSFKVWEMATVGGNLCLALPAGPMIALAVALEGRCTIWAGAEQREVDAVDFVTGERRTVLRAGEILRAIHLPGATLRRRATLRRLSLATLGRSAALLLGTTDGGDLRLTITAATTRPVRLEFAEAPGEAELARRMEAIDPLLHDDVHGAPAWRRHGARLLAEEIRRELAP